MRDPDGPPRMLHTEAFYPGHVLPWRPSEDRPGLSPFGRQGKGQCLGKASILLYDRHSSDVQASSVDMLTVTGDDLDAGSLVLTLHPPRVIPQPFDVVRARLDQQNLTGEQTNAEVTFEDFPGTHARVRWPPLEASIEFGVGGVNTKVVVDYVNGVTLSVVASYLRVQAIVTQNRENGDIEGTSAAYYLAAHVGPGFIEGNAQRTVFVGEVPDETESVVLDLPKFARIARLVGHQIPSPAKPVATIGWIRFWQSPSGENGVGDFLVNSSQDAIDIPNAAMYFSVFNESGHPMKLSVIFELSL